MVSAILDIVVPASTKSCRVCTFLSLAVAFLTLIGHVNNVMYNKYAETGRVQFTHNHAEHATDEEKQQWLDLVTPKNLGLILKSIKTEYKFVHPQLPSHTHRN